jgi:CshA-type fibril repeat protein
MDLTYQYSVDSGSSWHTLTTSGAGPITATVSGLTNGTSVTVWVRARNEMGHSPSHAAAAATPQAATQAPAPTARTSSGVGTAVQHSTIPLSAGQTARLVWGGQQVTRITRAGIGTYLINPATGVITFGPVLGYSGTPSAVTFRVTDSLSRTGSSTYTPTVAKPSPPNPANKASTGSGAQSVTVSLIAGRYVSLVGGNGRTYTDPWAGTFQVTNGANSATITFTPASRFSGGEAVGYRMTDAYGQSDTANYTANVPEPAPLPAIIRVGYRQVPRNPASFHSRTPRKTVYYLSSYWGADAYPIPDLGSRTLNRGQAMTLSGDGLFDFDSPHLTAEGVRQVQFAVWNLRGTHSVTCEGFTDYAGQLSHEVRLSQQRAATICAALRAYGANVTTSSVGYGPRHPVVIGGTAQARKQNRRVVIVVTG